MGLCFLVSSRDICSRTAHVLAFIAVIVTVTGDVSRITPPLF